MTEERPAGIHMGHPLNDEMTLCGFAIDAFDGEHLRVAKPGNMVTCITCRKVIRSVKDVHRWRTPKA